MAAGVDNRVTQLKKKYQVLTECPNSSNRNSMLPDPSRAMVNPHCRNLLHDLH